MLFKAIDSKADVRQLFLAVVGGRRVRGGVGGVGCYVGGARGRGR